MIQPDGTLDCGDSSCFFATKRGGMRTNGGCRCLQDLDPRAATAVRRMILDARAAVKALEAKVRELEGR